MKSPAAQAGARRSLAQLWLGAFVGFYRPSAAEVRDLDPVSRFLYSARSVILVISAQAALIAGLLALAAGRFDGLSFALVLVGLVVAHMISNLSNDYFGYKRGHDTPDSPRMRYTVHPLASGVLEPRVLVAGLAILAAAGCAIAAYFIYERGWLVAAFVAAGVALMFLYDAAPVPLKSIGLGELAVFLVWGPLMIGGGYAAIAGQVPAGVLYASLPYGLGVMSILTGKHIDQMDFDARVGNRTLPVLVGERAARAFNAATIVLMYAVLAALITFGLLTPFAALAALALPRALRAVRVMSRPRPAAPPAGYVGWPLWYHRACLQHNRLFGWSYIAGLALAAAVPLAAAQSPSTHQHSFGDAEKWAHVFDDPERDAWQKPHEVIKALALAPDAVVADIGAGTGYFSARLANMLKSGRVYAVDIEPAMVKHLAARAKREGLKNLVPVAGGAESPRLPAKVDLALFVDVYHHVDDRSRYFGELRKSLNPGGKVAIVDFRLDSPEGPPKAARIAPERVKAEMKKAGYVLAEEHAFLPRQYFLVFRGAPM